MHRDIRAYYRAVLNDAAELNDHIVAAMLELGVYNRAPYISVPEKSAMLTKQSFLTGFAQTVKSDSARQYLWRGKEIATKHIKVFADVLIENDLSAPMVADVTVTERRRERE